MLSGQFRSLHDGIQRNLCLDHAVAGIGKEPFAVCDIFRCGGVIGTGHDGNHGITVFLYKNVGLSGFLSLAAPDSKGVNLIAFGIFV